MQSGVVWTMEGSTNRTRYVRFIKAFTLMALAAISCTNKVTGADVNNPGPEGRPKASTRDSVQVGRYIAYSLKGAQQRIARAGDNWRQKEPEVMGLGGINKMVGFVFDNSAGDLILVGQKEQGRAALTLDDLVVALRRWCYITPIYAMVKSTVGAQEPQPQSVSFERGIENTAFGQSMFEAARRLQELSTGLAEPGVGGLRSVWDREAEATGTDLPLSQKAPVFGVTGASKKVFLHLLLCPIVPHVVVQDGVCVVRGMKVAVFANVVTATINDQPMKDVKSVEDASRAFANDVSQRFDDLARADPSFNRLRGLLELAAVSDASQELEESPDLSYWLRTYVIAEADTPETTQPLYRRYKGDHGWFEVSSSVLLDIHSTRLGAGHMTSLRAEVLKVRPSSNAMIWSFDAGEWMIPIEVGRAKSEDVAAFWLRARRARAEGYDANALPVFDEMIRLDPRLAWVWFEKAETLGLLDRTDEAIQCYDRALEINPRHTAACNEKAAMLDKLGRTEEAIQCYDRALQTNPYNGDVWSNKGNVIANLGHTEEAIQCYDRAIEIDSRNTVSWYNKGLMLDRLGRTDDTFQCFANVVKIDPRHADAWFNMGCILHHRGQLMDAINCYDHALAIDPEHAGARKNRAIATMPRPGVPATSRIQPWTTSSEPSYSYTPVNGTPPEPTQGYGITYGPSAGQPSNAPTNYSR
jgi:tetratricopeptide (TPR) repeat protein